MGGGAAESEDQPPASQNALGAVCAEVVRELESGEEPACEVLNLCSSLPAHLPLPVSPFVILPHQPGPSVAGQLRGRVYPALGFPEDPL